MQETETRLIAISKLVRFLVSWHRNESNPINFIIRLQNFINTAIEITIHGIPNSSQERGSYSYLDVADLWLKARGIKIFNRYSIGTRDSVCVS
jgi:hypothetical protein